MRWKAINEERERKWSKMEGKSSEKKKGRGIKEQRKFFASFFEAAYF